LGKMAAYYEEARRMFVQEGKTISEIARELKDVSERTLQRWSAEGEWAEKRKEYIIKERKLNDILEELKYKLAIVTLDDPNPQNVYALCRIIAVLKPSAAVELRQIEKEEAEAKKKSPEEVQKIVQETLENYYGVKIRDES